MGKVKTSSRKLFYTQKFRKEWLQQNEFTDWLKECKDSSKAYCNFCRCEIKAKLADLICHSKTKKHIKAANPFITTNSRQTTLDVSINVNTYKKAEAEGRLAMSVCNHCAIMSVDHLGLLCKSAFEHDLNASQFRIHRTKCSGII